MIWSLLGVCRNLKQWSTVVKSPCARVGSFSEFHCWIPKEANKHLSAFPFRYFNRKRIHNTRGILSNWKFASAAKCSSFNGLGREVKPYRRRPSDLHFTQDICSMKWNDCFPLIVSLFLLYDCRHLKNYCFISFQTIFFFKKKHDIHRVKASHKAVSYVIPNSVSKYGIPSFRLLARVRGLWGLQNNTGCYHSSWLFITLGFKTYYWTYLYLDPRTWTNQAEDDLEASTLMAIFP